MVKGKPKEMACAAIAPEEFARFERFQETHVPKSASFDGKLVRYYSCGKGKTTVLFFSGGHSVLEYLYDPIMDLEKKYRVVAVDFSSFNRLDPFSDAVTRILDAEGIGSVMVMGQSATGIHAQHFFMRHPERVQGVVLVNTLAPRKERARRWALIFVRMIPMRLFFTLVRKKMGRFTEPVENLPQETARRVHFRLALFADLFEKTIRRETLMSLLENGFEFNENGYFEGKWKEWKGRVLIVTSEDDPEYRDVPLLEANLPNARVVCLSSGYRHMAPAVEKERFLNLITGFFDGKEYAGV